ncbi:hypothetical protein A2335_04585 [Candidatus Peregrinibacteria bacterium RIFOXYB2_FULL_32_7]|nr:MAG: hypothetical protein A2335_04585 [Candidatus Peregrinibacteria bacterium RIFOXYB2_FULL_32_7]
MILQKFFRGLIFFFLRIFTKFKLWRIKPQIIGITGSYAKTSTREALALILASKFKIKKNQESFNTEYGICLDLLNIDNTGKICGKHSIRAWLKILIKGFINALFSKEKYDKLILEIGIDKPKDIDLILKVIKPNIQIITGITLNHVEFGFESEADIWNEKKKLLYALNQNGTAVLNADDKYVSTAIKDLKCKIINFGENNKNADLQAKLLSNTVDGLEIEFEHQGKKAIGKFAILGSHHSTVLLAAISGALALNFSLEEAIKILENFQLPEHRMTKIEGINKCIMLDSTYNASPKTLTAALDLLLSLSANRKLAVLGCMNELGDFSKRKHIQVGKCAADSADLLIAVGDEADFYIQGWKEKCEKQYFSFADSQMAAQFLKDFVKEGDLLLIKGSRGIEMERIVATLNVKHEA